MPLILNSKQADRLRLIAALGVSPAEYALFTVVHYGIPVTPADLPSMAARKDYRPCDSVSEELCRSALADCLAEGWLQVIDEPALARITAELREGQYLGPIYALPSVGQVDFTEAGAERWFEIHPQRSPLPCPYTDAVHINTAQYYRSEAAALAAIKEAKQNDNVVSVTNPAPIGPWRVQWWRRFPEGFRIDIDERMKWQGRSGGSTHPYCDMPSLPRDNLQGLPHILDSHNVTRVEWLFLAAQEQSYTGTERALFNWIAESATDCFGMTLSDEDCRAGLENCLRYGWLRIVDQHVLDEIEDQLRDGTAAVLVPREAHRCLGEIEFTPKGATLYRMLAADWLGPDWEDRLVVTHEYYREVHYYCECEEGVLDAAQREELGEETIRACRIVPIGPWCVYWWKRFSAGFRMELEIGEP